MTKYQEWIAQQPKAFVKEIHTDGIAPEQFKDDRKNMELDLEGLELLDNQYINNPED